jgi:hypothetical protein
MKTKTFILSLSAFIFCSSQIHAQVEVEKTKGTLTGKNKLIVLPIPESLLNSFSISYYNYFFGSDAGGNNAKGNFNTVSVEATLEGLDNQLVQEITDEAYTYYLNKWKERGIIVKCPTVQEIEATKSFEKDKKKGKAEILNSGVSQEGNNYAKYLSVIPANTYQVKKEAYGNSALNNSHYFVDYRDSKTTSNVSFNFALNFISFKTGFGSSASISGKTGLKSTCSSSYTVLEGAKPLFANYSNEASGGSDFVESCEGCKGGSKWKVKINKEKYKSVAIEMIKKSIDALFAEYDADVEKEKK